MQGNPSAFLAKDSAAADLLEFHFLVQIHGRNIRFRRLRFHRHDALALELAKSFA
jgi:hypothetical protein